MSINIAEEWTEPSTISSYISLTPYIPSSIHTYHIFYLLNAPPIIVLIPLTFPLPLPKFLITKILIAQDHFTYNNKMSSHLNANSTKTITNNNNISLINIVSHSIVVDNQSSNSNLGTKLLVDYIEHTIISTNDSLPNSIPLPLHLSTFLI